MNRINSNKKFKIEEIMILNYTLYLKDILDILNIEEENNLIYILRQYVCLKCYKVIDNKDSKNVDFPCGCCICNKEEFENYFTVETQITDNYICICGYIYKPKDLYSLAIQCNKIQCDLILLFIINIFNKFILTKGCCVCGKDEKRNEIKYELENQSYFCFENFLQLKQCNINLDHFICYQCKKKFEKQQFLCFYCNRIHLYVSDK